MNNAQPFRAGDTVEVLSGPCKGEHWGIAVYDAKRDEAWIAGWPCALVANATKALRIVEAVSDEEHAEMVEQVRAIRSDHGGRDPRAVAIESVLAAGGTP